MGRPNLKNGKEIKYKMEMDHKCFKRVKTSKGKTYLDPNCRAFELIATRICKDRA